VSWQIGGGDAGNPGIAGGAVTDGAGAGVLPTRRRGRLGLRTRIQCGLLLYGLLPSPTVLIVNSTMMSNFSSYGSLRSPSGVSRSPLMNAPVGILDVFNEDLPNPLSTHQILESMPTYPICTFPVS
jgi:hypothetical protein